MITGTVFTASAFGYCYKWEITSEILDDAFGKPFLWAKPILRVSGKQGRLRRPVPWHLELPRKQKFRQALLPIEI